jgi:hypothetical protein
MQPSAQVVTQTVTAILTSTPSAIDMAVSSPIPTVATTISEMVQSAPDFITIIAPFVPFVALAISLISLAVSVASFRRTARYQDYDYTPSLQLTTLERAIADLRLWPDFEAKIAEPDCPKAFTYKGKVENKGAKTVKIDNIYMECGARDDPTKRTKWHLSQSLYLSPGDDHEVQFKMSWQEVLATEERLGTDECAFVLRVYYRTPTGKQLELNHLLFYFHNHTTPAFVVDDGPPPRITMYRKKPESDPDTTQVTSTPQDPDQ